MTEKAMATVSTVFGRCVGILNRYPYLFVGVGVLSVYVWYVNRHRFDRLNAIKRKYGFTNDPKTYMNMTPDQAQAVERNLAEYEMPFLYEFAWLFDFLRVSSSLLPYPSSNVARHQSLKSPGQFETFILSAVLIIIDCRPVAHHHYQSSLATRDILSTMMRWSRTVASRIPSV